MKKKIFVLTAGALLVTAGTTVYAASTQDGNHQHEMNRFHSNDSYRDYGMMGSLREGK